MGECRGERGAVDYANRGGCVVEVTGLIADGKHCLSDLVSDFAVLFANHASRKDADKDHPFGHHRFGSAAVKWGAAR